MVVYTLFGCSFFCLQLEASCLQYSGASLLTVDNFSFLLTVLASSLSVLAFLLTVGAFLLTMGKCV